MTAFATLALEDGKVFHGRAFGALKDGYGEVCFNTSMSGYQEVLTDPSYAGQIITMTVPHVGNVGVNPEDMESSRIWAGGFVIRELTDAPSNFRSKGTLDGFLKKYSVPGIAGVDTRAITKHLRDHGAKRGVILAGKVGREEALQRAKASPAYDGVDWVRRVTTPKAFAWREGLNSGIPGISPPELGLVDRGLAGAAQPAHSGLRAGVAARHKKNGKKFRVVAIDCGIKYNILRNLVSHGCEVQVVPATVKSREILAHPPDGVFLSNGPGDPNALGYVVDTVRDVVRAHIPVFGICLGHQMLTLAFGGRMGKLKFGHRGGNQPVRDQRTRKVEITSQNHGFATVRGSLKDKDVVIGHLGLNDNVIEGLAHKRLPVFSVQYHPEASPGPHDANYLFRRFTEMMRTKKAVV